MKTIIEVKGINKIFGPNPKEALQLFEKGESKQDIIKKTRSAVGVYQANFTVEAGETLVIMGLSGSGKSTLLRCLNRLHNPSSGEIIIEGTDITKLNKIELRKFRQKKFGMVFQKFALLPHRTVLENIAFGLELQKVPKEERLKKAAQSLELVGLSGWGNSYASELSGGMQQRVGIARALAVEPEILLMDEAFSALDPLIRSDMQDELMELQDRVQKTIVFITHDLDEALKIGDRIVLMKDGKIVQIGTPDEILNNPASRYVERFVENVNRTQYMSAKDVMVKAATITYGKDGPKVALKVMSDHNLSSVFVVNRQRKIKGIILRENAEQLVEKRKQKLDDAIEEYTKYKVSPDKPLTELLPIMVDNRYPVAVVSEDDKLKGMIVRGSVIAAISEGVNNA